MLLSWSLVAAIGVLGVQAGARCRRTSRRWSAGTLQVTVERGRAHPRARSLRRVRAAAGTDAAHRARARGSRGRRQDRASRGSSPPIPRCSTCGRGPSSRRASRAAESARRRRARRARARSAAELAFAQSELKRAQSWSTRRCIAPASSKAAERQAKTLERALQSAEFAVRTAEHQLELARASLLQSARRQPATIPLYSPVERRRPAARSRRARPSCRPASRCSRSATSDDLEIVSDLLSSAAVRRAGRAAGADRAVGRRSAAARPRAAGRAVRASRRSPRSASRSSASTSIIDFDEPRRQRGRPRRRLPRRGPHHRLVEGQRAQGADQQPVPPRGATGRSTRSRTTARSGESSRSASATASKPRSPAGLPATSGSSSIRATPSPKA